MSGKIREQIDIAIGTHRIACRGTEQPVAAAMQRRRCFKTGFELCQRRLTRRKGARLALVKRDDGSHDKDRNMGTGTGSTYCQARHGHRDSGFGHHKTCIVNGGGGGIRTHGTHSVQRFSRPPRSTAPAPLRAQPPSGGGADPSAKPVPAASRRPRLSPIGPRASPRGSRTPSRDRASSPGRDRCRP